MKLLFTPVSIVTGLIAGLVGRKTFEKLWSLIDDQDPPNPGDRRISIPKFLVALTLEGIIFMLVKGLADRSSRIVVFRFTGRWPGDDAPDEA